jgi:site-specific DNA-methyltransferase (adenine-specific)
MTEAYNADCMDAMARMKDNEFDLAIVDPPYGLNIAKTGSLGQDKFKPKSWDIERPELSYFQELFRVSSNQIIWGWNYFSDLLPPCKGPIYWNKLNHHNNRSDGELAYVSFDCLLRHFQFMWDGNRHGFKNGTIKGVGEKSIRIHPTQKPVELYKWLLKNYAKEGDRILDTHLGSGSSRIAAHDMGFDFVGYEIDEDYFKAQEKRFANHIQQQSLFQPKEMY